MYRSHVVRVVVVLPVIALSTSGLRAVDDPSPPDDRPTEKTGYIPALITIDAPQTQWTFESENGIGVSDPAAANGMLFFGDDKGDVRALTAKHGRQIWLHQGGTRVFFPPTSDGERLYYSTRLGVTALDGVTGHPLWTHSIQGGSGRSLVDDRLETVFCAGSDGWLYAFESSSGEVKWRASLVVDAPGDQPGFDGGNARFDGTAARPTGIACDGEQVYQSVFDQSRVLAFDARTGERRWALQTKGWVFGDSAVDNEMLFVGSQDKHFYAVDKRTGQILWKQATDSRVESGPAVDETRVYIASCDGHLYAFRKRDGVLLWKFATDNGQRGAIYSAPIVNDDTLFFAASKAGVVYALESETGRKRWSFIPSEGSGLYSSLATDGERVFVKSRPSGAVGQNAIFAIGQIKKSSE